MLVSFCLRNFSCLFLFELFQNVFPDLYDKMKILQKKLIHDEIPFPSKENQDNVLSAGSAASSSVSFCPNPHHPMSFTTDMWSGPDHESYICLTAHWLGQFYDIHHLLLDIFVCTDRHTGEM